MLTKEKISGLIQEYGKNKNDTGKTEVQIALLDSRIKDLNEHFKKNPKDNHSRRGLIALVNQRKRMVEYLKKKNPESYKTLIQKLGIRK
jgi:small subunit ribosomal protein S15